jgi:hypothetical protein
MEISVNVNGEAFVFNTETDSEAAFRYVMEYGLRQTLADAGASKKERADKVEAARERYRNLLEGNVPSGGGGGGVDPVSSAMALLLKSARVRKLAQSKYAAEDVPSARDVEGMIAFADHFAPEAWVRIEKAARAMVAAKALDIE